MSKETLAPPLPPIDARTEAVAERLFGLKWALRKDSTEIIHEEWNTASEWIRDGYLRQAIEVLAAADQAEPASAKASGYQDRMRVEYRDLTARAGRLRDMLQRYADGTLDFEPTCPISLLSRQLDVMDEYALILRRRAIALQKHISEALAGLQTLSGSEDIQISHALTMATVQASKALKQAHLMQDSADMLDQADQRDEENNISRMLISKIAQQGE